jgi:DNA-binding CsgD family transcriptional regulator
MAARNEQGTGTPLTDRELTVVRLVAEGRTSAQIGRDLHISPNTVDSHVRKAYAKTGTHSRAQLTLWLRDGAQ